MPLGFRSCLLSFTFLFRQMSVFNVAKASTTAATCRRPFIDVAVNLLDPMFQGVYNGKQRHESDMQDILERATKAGVQKIMITGTTTEESAQAAEMAMSLDSPVPLFFTCGVHPTCCAEYEAGEGAVEAKLLETIAKGRQSGRLVTLGEAGLDYDRLHFCSKELQVSFLLPYDLYFIVG